VSNPVFLESSFRILLFDLSIHGHHAAYIKHLIRYWSEKRFKGSLFVVVSPKFIEVHADVVELALAQGASTIEFVAITIEEEAVLNSRRSKFDRALRNLREWHLLQKYAESLAATECLLMYLDTCELPLVLGSGLACPFSGIYFRPTFHYSDLAGYVPDLKERLQQWREKIFLNRLLHHPKLKSLFCLDPFVVKYLDPPAAVGVVHLPDPVETNPLVDGDTQDMRSALAIDSDRLVFLLFGSFEAERKGVYQLFEALERLPPSLCQKVCIILVGNAGQEEQSRIQVRVDSLCQHHPVQIITRFGFIPDQDVEQYFLLADVALAIYQRHVGMSGILLLAAAAQKPVLSSNYGLMGELVKRHHLGLTVNSTVPEEIAAGLTRFLLESSQSLSDRAAMKAFAEQNSARLFAQTVFQHVSN